MAADNLGADIDEVDISMEEPVPPAELPHIVIQQATIDYPSTEEIDAEREETKVETESPVDEASRPASLPQTSTDAEPKRPDKSVDVQLNGETRLEQPWKRKLTRGFFGAAARVGSWLDRMAPRRPSSLSLALVRKAHRLYAGGLRPAERVAGVKYSQMRVRLAIGESQQQYSFRIYYPQPTVERNNLASRCPVVLFIHGNLPFANARIYHSFNNRLCADLLETNAVVAVLDMSTVPEKTLVELVDDVVNVADALMLGDLDVEFDHFGLLIDHQRVVLGGDGGGALLCFAAAIELARTSTDKRPGLSALFLISPPLQALTTRMFESHIKYDADNCAQLSHRLDFCLPLYAGLKTRSEVIAARQAVEAERHMPTALRNRLLKRIFPTFEPTGPARDNSQATGFGLFVGQLAGDSKVWPMLMKNKDIGLLPPVMMQACEKDTLFDEERLFAKRMRKACGDAFHLSVIANATHSEAVQHLIVKTQAAQLAYKEVLAFVREALAVAPKDEQPQSSSQ